jgi:hypothetical protein
MLLIPQPYTLEPGLEKSGGTKASNEYNRDVRIGTLKLAWNGPMRKPPANGINEIDEPNEYRRAAAVCRKVSTEQDRAPMKLRFGSASMSFFMR